MLHNKKWSEYEPHVMITGGISFLLGVVALAGRITGKNLLASLVPDYLPMATTTAISAVGLSFIFLSWYYRNQSLVLKSAIVLIVTLLSTYGLLKFLEFVTNARLTLDFISFSENVIKAEQGNYRSINSMSPFAGLLFFLSGISVLLLLLNSKRPVIVHLASSLGIIVAFSGFAYTFGYIEGNPLLYGSGVIPLSLPTSLVILFLGAGLVFAAGERSIFLRYVSGNSSSAKLLRAIIPLTLAAILLDRFLEAILSKYISINIPILLAVVTIFLMAITVILAIRIARIIFRDAEKAEKERLLAVEALKESEERYRLIIENQGEGIGLVDTEERFVYVNPAAEKIFGVGPGRLVNRNLMEFLKPEYIDEVLRETKKRSQSEHSSYEIEIVTPGEEHRVILVTASPQFDDNGTFTGTFGVFRDLSERKLAEAKLAEFNEELKELNATKDKFFSIIAHDLRNPFNLLLGYSNILTEEIENKNFGEAHALSSRIFSVSKSTYSLLENLLTWSQVQTRNISFSKESFNLGEILAPELKLLTAMAEQKNIMLVNQINNPAELNADINMIITVIRNLVNNAIKFTMQGGVVTLSSETGDNEITFHVRDTGTGMSKEEVDKLFDVSKAVSKPGTAREKGTGLGLILCKEFVTLHGGNIRVESEPGQGSRFSFTIPV